MEITNMSTEPEKKPLDPAPTQPGGADTDAGGHAEPPKPKWSRARRL